MSAGTPSSAPSGLPFGQRFSLAFACFSVGSSSTRHMALSFGFEPCDLLEARLRDLDRRELLLAIAFAEIRGAPPVEFVGHRFPPFLFPYFAVSTSSENRRFISERSCGEPVDFGEKRRIALHENPEVPRAHDQQLAIVDRGDVGGAPRAGEQRHLADEFARPKLDLVMIDRALRRCPRR